MCQQVGNRLEIRAGCIGLGRCAGARIHGPNLVRDPGSTGDLPEPFAVGALTDGQAVLALHDRTATLRVRHYLKQREQHRVVMQAKFFPGPILRGLKPEPPARDVLPTECTRPHFGTSIDSASDLGTSRAPLADDVLLSKCQLKLSRHSNS